MNSKKWTKIIHGYPSSEIYCEVEDSVGKIGKATYETSKGWIFDSKMNPKDFNNIIRWRKL